MTISSPAAPGKVTAPSMNLSEGMTPMDLLNANMRRPPPAGEQPGTVTTVPNPAAALETTFADPIQFPVDVPPPAEVKPAEPVLPGDPPVTPDPEVPLSEADKLLDSVLTKGERKAESLKHLRTKAQETQQQLDEEKRQREETALELARYKSGEAIPDVLREKDEQISELAYFRDLHAIKFSPEYRRKFVEPMAAMKEKLVDLAKESGVDIDAINRAFAIEDKKERNAFLKNNFGDDLAVLDVRDTMLKMEGLHAESVAAEQKPAETLENLKVEYRNREAADQTSRVNAIVNNSKEGWVSALTELRSTGEYPELSLRGEPEHDKIVATVLKEAGEELGKLIRQSGQNGMKDLPLDTAKILAKTFLLARISPITAASRADHYRRAEEVIQHSRNTAGMSRPVVGSPGTPGGSLPQPKRTIQQGAEDLLNEAKQKALQKR